MIRGSSFDDLKAVSLDEIIFLGLQTKQQTIFSFSSNNSTDCYSIWVVQFMPHAAAAAGTLLCVFWLAVQKWRKETFWTERSDCEESLEIDPSLFILMLWSSPSSSLNLLKIFLSSVLTFNPSKGVTWLEPDYRCFIMQQKDTAVSKKKTKWSGFKYMVTDWPCTESHCEVPGYSILRTGKHEKIMLQTHRQEQHAWRVTTKYFLIY